MFAQKQREGHMLLRASAFMFSELMCAVGKGTRDCRHVCWCVMLARDALMTRKDS